VASSKLIYDEYITIVHMRRFTCELKEYEKGVASSDLIYEYNTIVRMRRFTYELNKRKKGIILTQTIYNLIHVSACAGSH
jgi:hypothetical protein